MSSKLKICGIFGAEEFCSVQWGSPGDLGTTSVAHRAACESMHRHTVAVGQKKSPFGDCLQEKWYFGEENELSFCSAV